ncbi:MAG: FtsX-like permease family protein, partial [Pseudomonadota bacterium]
LPFRISGILAKTGTPVDRTVHVSLRAIEAIHIGWGETGPDVTATVTADRARQMPLQPRSITAVMVGLKTKFATFRLQRFVNTYRLEPLSAILPGATLYELWGLVGTAETALQVVSIMVVITALLGMMTMILSTLNERRREMAILRSVGAGPRTVVGLMVSEAGVLTFAGALLGIVLTYVGIMSARPLIDEWYGLYIAIQPPTRWELTAIGAIVAGGIIAGLLPAWRAYRTSLADGMRVRN